MKLPVRANQKAGAPRWGQRHADEDLVLLGLVAQAGQQHKLYTPVPQTLHPPHLSSPDQSNNHIYTYPPTLIHLQCYLSPLTQFSPLLSPIFLLGCLTGKTIRPS